MPRRKPGRPPSADIRHALLEAAAELFASAGVDATTTRELVARAGTTERTLFKHFGNKDGLVQAVMDRVAVGVASDPSLVRMRGRETLTRAAFAAWHADFLAERVAMAEAAPQYYRGVIRELLRDDTFRQRYGSNWLAAVFEPLVVQLGRMQAAGEIGRGVRPAELAGLFFTLNLGYLLTRFVWWPEGEWKGKQDITSVVKLFLTAMGEGSRPPGKKAT